VQSGYALPYLFSDISHLPDRIRNLPMILSLVLASLVAGGIITVTGYAIPLLIDASTDLILTLFRYYTPFLYASSVLMAVGAGLLATLKVDSGPARWIGYQIVFGLGVGLGMQQPMIAAQTVLELADVPVGTSIIIFTQTLGQCFDFLSLTPLTRSHLPGGALFISVGQNVCPCPLSPPSPC
jgi:hypothetical protein